MDQQACGRNIGLALIRVSFGLDVEEERLQFALLFVFWRLLALPVIVEVGQFLLHDLEVVGEGAGLEPLDGLLDPDEQVRGEGLVVVLKVVLLD